MIELIQPRSGKVLRVAEEAADFWRGLGYRDAKPEPVDEKPKRAPRKATSDK